MAQSFALSIFVCCFLGQLACATGSQPQLHEQQRLEDSEALVQTLTHVDLDEDKPGKSRKTVRELVLMVDQKVKDLHKRQLANLTSKLKTKFQEVLEKLPRSAQEEALNRTVEANGGSDEPESEAESGEGVESVEAEEESLTTPHPSVEELMEEKRAKFGEVIPLVVRNPLDGDVNVTFRTSTRMHVLFASLCKRAGVKRADAHFSFKGQELSDDQTPESAGLQSGSVIDLFSQPLEIKREARDRENVEFSRRSRSEVKAEVKVDEHEVEKANLKKQKELDAIARAAQKNKALRLKEQRRRKENMVNLRFVDPSGDQVNMQVKRDVPLNHIFSLACKRLGISQEKAAFYFGDDHKRISMHGTVQSLGLHHNAVIEVRKPFANSK